ncbi:JmjC domain-containing histone demethylation protein 1, partial [Ascosphaera acerosa]
YHESWKNCSAPPIELISAAYFEHGVGLTEPVVVAAESNPRTPVEGGITIRNAAGAEETVPCTADRLGMVRPAALTVRDVERLVGPDAPVEVIDVKTQRCEGGTAAKARWTLRAWADYFADADPRKPVRNVISLEVSDAPLGRLVTRPRIVREIDLQDQVWPETDSDDTVSVSPPGESPPRVALYVLMSVADSYTDFHVDFGGSSVYYHVVSGRKTFLLVPPTENNLRAYEDWCNSPAQDTTFFPDLLPGSDSSPQCTRVDLSAGDTMLIPAGWIHAVWTPADSLVLGGNFLTRIAYPMQLRVAAAEHRTRVPQRFRYPHFARI